MRWLYSITDSMDVCLSKLREIVKDRELACCSPWGRRVGYDLVPEQHVTYVQSNKGMNMQINNYNMGFKEKQK